MWYWSQNLIHDSSWLHTDSGCNVVNDCDSSAQCLLDPATEEHHCRCNAGFSGDGKTCVADPIGCNVINNCHIAADCVYDQGATGYRCRCKKVRTCMVTSWLHYWQRITQCVIIQYDLQGVWGPDLNQVQIGNHNAHHDSYTM